MIEICGCYYDEGRQQGEGTATVVCEEEEGKCVQTMWRGWSDGPRGMEWGGMEGEVGDMHM